MIEDSPLLMKILLVLPKLKDLLIPVDSSIKPVLVLLLLLPKVKPVLVLLFILPKPPVLVLLLVLPKDGVEFPKPVLFVLLPKDCDELFPKTLLLLLLVLPKAGVEVFPLLPKDVDPKPVLVVLLPNALLLAPNVGAEEVFKLLLPKALPELPKAGVEDMPKPVFEAVVAGVLLNPPKVGVLEVFKELLLEEKVNPEPWLFELPKVTGLEELTSDIELLLLEDTPNALLVVVLLLVVVVTPKPVFWLVVPNPVDGVDVVVEFALKSNENVGADVLVLAAVEATLVVAGVDVTDDVMAGFETPNDTVLADVPVAVVFV